MSVTFQRAMASDKRLDGYWWSGSGRDRRPGVLEAAPNRRAVLHLNGSFPNFVSFEPGGRGAPSRRNLIRGRTADGRLITLVDCVVRQTITQFPRRRGGERTDYSATWYIDGAHFSTYADLRFAEISFTCDYLNDLIGETFVSPDLYKRGRGFRFSYRSPRDVRASVERHSIRASQFVPLGLSLPLHLTEYGNITVATQRPETFDAIWEGPVKTVRSLLSFTAERHLPLRGVRARVSREDRHWCELVFPNVREVEPRRSREHGAHEFLFTIRQLTDPPRWSDVLARWAAFGERYGPVLALYSAATNELRLFNETRFLMLAQALETYHRTRYPDATRVPLAAHEERIKRILQPLQTSDRSWLAQALQWSNSPTLRERLTALYADIRRPLLDHLRISKEGLVQQIVHTRNYLTHFDPASTAHRVAGFRLLEVTENMRIVLQYFALIELGFSSAQAFDIAHHSFIRGLQRVGLNRGLL